MILELKKRNSEKKRKTGKNGSVFKINYDQTLKNNSMYALENVFDWLNGILKLLSHKNNFNSKILQSIEISKNSYSFTIQTMFSLIKFDASTLLVSFSFAV